MCKFDSVDTSGAQARKKILKYDPQTIKAYDGQSQTDSSLINTTPVSHDRHKQKKEEKFDVKVFHRR